MELFDRFERYQAALNETDTDNNAPVTDVDAQRELETLKALRVQHFGPELAQKLFARDEAIARAFVDLLKLEKDESLSAEERQRRAAAIRESMPEVAQLEHRNRIAAEMAAEADESG